MDGGIEMNIFYCVLVLAACFIMYCLWKAGLYSAIKVERSKTIFMTLEQDLLDEIEERDLKILELLEEIKDLKEKYEVLG